MKPVAFSYERATSVDQTVALLKDAGNAKILAGGQSLMPLMNFRLVRPDLIVDIGEIETLRHISDQDSYIRIGALVPHAELASNPLIARRLPVLASAAQHIGHWAIRNRGTLGGSVAHADPAAELPALLIALEGTILVQSETARKVAAEQFFQGYFMTDLAPSEIITGVEIPVRSEPVGFDEVVRRSGDFALVGVYLIGQGVHSSVTWFGMGGRATRFSVPKWPQDFEERRTLLESFVESLALEDSEAYKKDIAINLAQTVYERLKGATNS